MTEDDRTTPHPRESLLVPVVIPLGILAVIGLVLWGFSRVLLHVKPHVATATALVVAAAIVAIVAIAASRKRVGNGSLLSVVVGVAGVGMLASGAALLIGGNVEEAGPEMTIALTAPADAAVNGFAQKSLSAPADVPFTIEFDNQEPNVNHNVVIASDDPTKDPSAQIFFTGTIVAGPAQTPYAITPLAEGTYYFFCEVHPTTMNGTLSVAPGPPPGAPAGPSTSITAAGTAFNTSTLTFVANETTSFDFQNDDALPHNLAIYTDSTATTSLFVGDAVNGPASSTYEIPKLKPGSYYFHCDFHPEQMNGTVTVVPAAEEPPPGGGGGPPPSGSGTPAPSESP